LHQWRLLDRLRIGIDVRGVLLERSLHPALFRRGDVHVRKQLQLFGTGLPLRHGWPPFRVPAALP
jgi:hypothetical protein